MVDNYFLFNIFKILVQYLVFMIFKFVINQIRLIITMEMLKIVIKTKNINIIIKNLGLNSVVVMRKHLKFKIGKYMKSYLNDDNLLYFHLIF